MSIYSTSRLGTVTNQIEFNTSTLPIFRVVSRAPQQRQIRDLDIPIPYESGISDYETLEGKSAYIISGVMYPGSEQQYEAALAQLRKLASLDIAQSDNNADDGYVPYVFDEIALNKQVFVKVLYVDLPEDTRKGLVQPFRLVCKVKDPTIFSEEIAVATTQGSDPTVSTGTALFPFSFPIQFGASTYSTSSVAVNEGDLEGYPINIKVVGPINTPTITNETTGQQITINTSITDGSVLTIKYDKDTLTADVDGNSVLGSVTNNSVFFKLLPGENNISLSGSAFDAGAYVELTYYKGYWPLS